MMQATLWRAAQIEPTVQVLRRALGESLHGVYLHGSAVSGGLRPQSDIDLLAVVGRGLTDVQRDELLAALLRLSGRHPAVAGGPRCLEVIVLCRSDLTESEFPVRAAFIYGEWLRDAFEAGRRPMPDRDPDHTLVIAQAGQEAMTLLGPHRDDLLPRVPVRHIRKAMRDAMPGLLKGLHGDERNALLTLARMWRTASIGQFATKDAAAGWAIRHLPASDAATLDHARRAYLGEVADNWIGQGDAVERLARYMSDHIAILLADEARS